MVYLTYNESPSGVYYSQVTDVCKYINDNLKADVLLISIISVRNFTKNRKLIKNEYRSSFVIPRIPKSNVVWLYVIILYLILKIKGKKVIVSRGIFATVVAQKVRRINNLLKVVFDGRGAYFPEHREYLNANGTDHSLFKIKEYERRSVEESDYRIAVSKKLVEYWKKEYNYCGYSHSTIPCTLRTSIVNENYVNHYNFIRKKLGVNEDEILLVYSGSDALWQSFYELDRIVYSLMNSDNRIKIMFLTKEYPINMNIIRKYKSKIIHRWESPSEVPLFLSGADYGLLIREYSVTNNVSAPTKFAEYLFSGLKIIISSCVGDYSAFVERNECGLVIDENNKMNIRLSKVSAKEKKRMRGLSIKYFSKDRYRQEYNKIISI